MADERIITMYNNTRTVVKTKHGNSEEMRLGV